MTFELSESRFNFKLTLSSCLFHAVEKKQGETGGNLHLLLAAVETERVPPGKSPLSSLVRVSSVSGGKQAGRSNTSGGGAARPSVDAGTGSQAQAGSGDTVHGCALAHAGSAGVSSVHKGELGCLQRATCMGQGQR